MQLPACLNGYPVIQAGRPRMTSYFVLITRDTPVTSWAVQFGDFNRQTVEDEKAEMRVSDKARKLAPYGAADCYKVIAVKSAKQAHINAAVLRLNAKDAQA